MESFHEMLLEQSDGNPLAALKPVCSFHDATHGHEFGQLCLLSTYTDNLIAFEVQKYTQCDFLIASVYFLYS